MKNQSFAYPLRVIEEIEGEQAAIDLLLEMLGREVDPFKPEKASDLDQTGWLSRWTYR